MNTRRRISKILDSLEAAREDLMALSEDIWMGIDHNDNDALDEGIAFKREFNDVFGHYSDEAARLRELITNFTEVKDNEGVVMTSEGGDERMRVIAELDTMVPHCLSEDFRYKRPYGLRLGDFAALELRTWRAIYLRVCSELVRVDPRRAAELVDAASKPPSSDCNSTAETMLKAFSSARSLSTSSTGRRDDS